MLGKTTVGLVEKIPVDLFQCCVDFVRQRAVLDREGRIAKKHSGIASKSQFEREIKSLL